MDYELVARQLLRALRGKRSQTAFSRRLGHRSNVAYAWESGRRFPSASRLFRIAARTGRDLRVLFGRPFQPARPPAWIARLDLTGRSAVAAFLRELRGAIPVGVLASRCGCSRFSLSRWLSGATEPRLPDLLRVVHAVLPRDFLDWLSGLCDPSQLPAIRREWERFEALRRVAHEAPHSEAILRVLELESYHATPHPPPGWIAARLGFSADDEARALAALRRARLIRRRRGRWVLDRVYQVSTRQQDEAALRQLKRFWAGVGSERLERGAGGLFSYNVFSVSAADLARLERLHLEYYDAMRAIIRESTPAECVGLVNLQLFALDADHRVSPRHDEVDQSVRHNRGTPRTVPAGKS